MTRLTTRTGPYLAAVLLPVLVSIAGCAGQAEESTGTDSTAANSERSVSIEPPTWDELANATYQGIEPTPVQLVDGLWQGEPFVEGGASAPRVGLVKGFLLTGDLNDDGLPETVALLWSSSGGSGTFDYIAVTGRTEEGVQNLATAELGDRVKVRGGRISEGRIVLDVVQAGPEDAACCPTQLATRTWEMQTEGLIEAPPEITGTLSLTEVLGPDS